MKFTLKIKIIENKISLFLVDDKKKNIAKSEWDDNKDLSEKLLTKIDLLLKRKKVSLNNISKFDFISSGKCGFTSRQIGEITAKVLNFRSLT
jgi:tRNA A37 threonylcarbamoyladenosine modification protein TsaB